MAKSNPGKVDSKGQRSTIWQNTQFMDPVRLAYKMEGMKSQAWHVETSDAQEALDHINGRARARAAEARGNYYRATHYGHPEIRAFERQQLQKQMEERETQKSQLFEKQLKEARRLIAQDVKDVEERRLQDTQNDSKTRTLALGNKQLIEERRMERRRKVLRENAEEQETLRHRPINWSHTMN